MPSLSSFRGLIFPLSFGVGVTLTYLSPFQLLPVEGPSMRPTLNPEQNKLTEDVLLVKKIRQPVSESVIDSLKGQIVIFQSPNRQEGFLSVKRITAIPGDQITTRKSQTVFIPPDHVWVESDAASDRPGVFRDSFLFGPLSKDNLKCVAMVVVWPPSRIGANLRK